MNKVSIITLLVLIILTVASAFFSNIDDTYAAGIILGFAALKFIGVAFQFMELKKAHVFWKVTLLTVLTVFTTITLSLL
jgi:hypothetical protein